MSSVGSLTRPLAATELFQQFQKAFETITGLPLSILAPGEFRVPEKAPDFCQMMGLAKKTCESCHELHANLQDMQGADSRTLECFAGMTSSSVAVKSSGETIAFLHAGHVFVGKNAQRNWQALQKFLERNGFDAEACEKALEQARVTDPAHYQSAIRLLEIFARQLSEALPLSTVSHPYPAVAQAIHLLREDVEKNWTLSEMARLVHMNTSYFSEMFRKITGTTFTSYLARLRIEKACKLLTSTRLNISEIAFASGFRSISQFNRVFKRYITTSPGDFRAQSKARSKF